MAEYKARLTTLRPYQGVEAVLYTVEGSRVDVDVTDERGLYHFKNIPSGQYEVRFFGRGYSEEDYITISVFDEVTFVTQHYIRPLDGTVFKSGNPSTLTFELIRFNGPTQEIVTSGDVKLWRKVGGSYDQILPSDDGVVSFDGYTLVINEEFVDGSINLYAVNEPADVEYDSITIADIQDGKGFVSWVEADAYVSSYDPETDTYAPPTITLTPHFALGSDEIDLDLDNNFTFTSLPSADGPNGVSVNTATGVVTIDSDLYFDSQDIFTGRWAGQYDDEGTIYNSAVTESVYSVQQGVPGEDGITVLLTNESHVFPAENDGTVTDYGNGGTRVIVYEGATKLNHSSGTLNDGEYKVTISSANNITAGLVSTNVNNEAILSQPSNMTADIASIELSVEIDPNSGSSNRTFNREQTFTLAKKGAAGPGSQSVILEADRYVITYDSQGTETPSGQQITFTATPSNHSGTVYYEFLVGGVTKQNTTSNTYVLSDGDEPASNESVLIKVITREDSPGNPTVSIDSLSVYGVESGATGKDGVTIINTNSTHSFPADDQGVVTDYSGGDTTFIVYEGATKLSHTTSSPSDGEFRVTVSDNTNISPGTISTVANEGFVGDPSNMTADTASVLYNLEINYQAAGPAENFAQRQTFTVAKQGQAGDSPEIVTLTADKYIITYDGSGAQDPSGQDINLTATEKNHTGTVYYEFIVGGASKQNTTSNTYQILDGDEPNPNETVQVEVRTRESGPGNSVVATDSISVYGTEPGADGTDSITILMPNEAHVFPAENDGTVTDYTGGGTKIIVFEGNTKLTHNSETLSDGQYKVTVDSNTNISPGTISTNGSDEAVAANPSNMTADTASITYQVEVDPSAGGTNKIFEKQQSFTVSKKGAEGPGSETVFLEADTYVITYDESEVETPLGQSITLTATEKNHTGTVYYEFYREGVSKQVGTSNTYAVPDADEPTPNQTLTYRVVTRIDGAGNPSVASDSITVFGVKNGGAGADGGGMIIEVDQTANRNGWYNTNVTWRLVFETSVFNAEYKVWKDVDGEPGSWTAWVGSDQTITSTGRWNIKARVFRPGETTYGYSLRDDIDIDLEDPVWPNADADIRTGFGAMRLENMTTVPVDPGVSGIWSFSGDEIIKVKINTIDDYAGGTTQLVDTLDAEQTSWQYYDIDAGDYYIWLDVESAASNVLEQAFDSVTSYQIEETKPSNLTDELGIIAEGINGSTYETRYALSQRIDGIEVTTSSITNIEAVEYFNLGSTSWEDVTSLVIDQDSAPSLPYGTTGSFTHIVSFNKVDTTGVRIQFNQPGNVTFWNPIEKLSAESFVGETFEAQRGIRYVNADGSGRQILLDDLGIRAVKQGGEPAVYNIDISDASFFVGYQGWTGIPDSYMYFDPDDNGGDGRFLLKMKDISIDSTEPNITMASDFGGTTKQVMAIGPNEDTPTVHSYGTESYSDLTISSPAIGNTTSFNTGIEPDASLVVNFDIDSSSVNTNSVFSIQVAIVGRRSSDGYQTYISNTEIYNSDVNLIIPSSGQAIANSADFDEIAINVQVYNTDGENYGSFTFENISMSVSNSTIAINNKGLFVQLSSGLKMGLTKLLGQGGSGGGGSTVATWGSVTGKPFETVDTSGGQFNIISNQLQLPQDLGTSSTPQFGATVFSGYVNVNTSNWTTTASTENGSTVVLKSSETAGSGTVGASIGFNRVSGGSNRFAAVAAFQSGSDADSTGLRFYGHSATAADPLELMAELDLGGLQVGGTAVVTAGNFSTYGVPKTGGVFTGQIIIDNSPDPLRLRGSTTGNANQVYMEFEEADGTRSGYLGVPSTNNSDIYLYADNGDLRLNPTGSFRVNNSVVFGPNAEQRLDSTGSPTFDGATFNDDVSSSGDLQSGRNSGGVALTINDGHGNANITFNHRNGVPEQDGNAARVEVNTDSSSGATMYFSLGSGVLDGQEVNLQDKFRIREDEVLSYVDLRTLGTLDVNNSISFESDRALYYNGTWFLGDVDNKGGDVYIRRAGNNAIQILSGSITFGKDLYTEDLRPKTTYTYNLGQFSHRYLTAYIGELNVATLVAQEEISTTGGRLLIGTSTELTSAVTTGATSINVKHNNLSNGDVIYLESRGKIEFMGVTSSPSGSGPYTYSVNRNLDGSSANSWEAGDGIFNSGQTGDGFIDQYAINSFVVPGATAGPSTAYMVRTGSAYNAIEPRTLVGNLDGFYGYSSTTFGFAAGDPNESYITVDPSDGIRLIDNGNVALQANANQLTIGNLSYTVSTDTLKTGGWTINTTSISSSTGAIRMGQSVTSGDEIRISSDGGGQGTSNYVRMYHEGSSTFGIEGVDGGNRVFHLGEISGNSVNEIAGWTFDDAYFQSPGRTGGGNGSTTSNGIIIHSSGYISTESFYIDTSGNAFFAGELDANSGEIAGWNISSTQLSSPGASGGGNGSFTSNGIKIHSSGYITAENFYLSSSGNGALGALNISGILTISGGSVKWSGGEITSNGIDFDAGESGVNMLEWRESGSLTGQVYSYRDGTGQNNLVVRSPTNGSIRQSQIFLTSSKTLITGILSFQKSTLTLAAGLLQIPFEQASTRITMRAETGNSDTLVGIRYFGTAPPDGSILILEADSGDTITIDDGFENLHVGGNVTLGNYIGDILMLVYNSSKNIWTSINRDP